MAGIKAVTPSFCLFLYKKSAARSMRKFIHFFTGVLAASLCTLGKPPYRPPLSSVKQGLFMPLSFKNENETYS